MELSFVQPVSEDFYCSICQSVLKEPVLTDCCGQHFCKKCLENWFKLALVLICPHCRTEGFKHIRSLPMLRMINGLTISCPMSRLGCPEVFRKDGLNEHLKICKYILVHCSNKCGEMVYRKDVEKHLLECTIKMQCYNTQSHILHTLTVQLHPKNEDSYHTHTFKLTDSLKAHLLLTLNIDTKPRQLLTKKQDGTISLIIDKSEEHLPQLEVNIEQVLTANSNEATSTSFPTIPLRSKYIACNKCNHRSEIGTHSNLVYKQKIFGHPYLKESLEDDSHVTVTIATHNCTPQ